MKTFKEFYFESIELLERYYKPDEKLPSGKTPVEKAEERSERPYNNTRAAKGRQIRQRLMTRRYVSHGADNPNLNLHTQPGIEVRGDKDSMSVYHPSSDISYSINRKGKTKIGDRPVYDVRWQHHKSTDMSPKEKITVGRDAKDVWDYHVQHRLPHGAVLRNSPVPNPTSKNPQKNTRARLYQKSGFGPVGQKGLTAGQQFALVGRKPSTKQIRKGKTRLSPLSGNTQYDAYD